MKINDYKIGTQIELTCTKEEHKTNMIPDGKFFYSNFNISKEHAYMWGRKPEQVIKVRATIIEEDVIIIDKFRDKSYDENCIDYFALITWEDDGTLDIGLFYPNIKMYNICFPYPIDDNLFWDKDIKKINWETYEEKIIHKKGDRHKMTVRLKIEEI